MENDTDNQKVILLPSITLLLLHDIELRMISVSLNDQSGIQIFQSEKN